MPLSFGRKLSLFTANAVLVSALAAGATGYVLMDRGLTRSLRTQVSSTNTLIASRAADELRDLAERAQAHAPLGIADPVSLASYRYFEGHDELLGLSLVKAPPADSTLDTPWTPIFRWSRGAEDPGYLSAKGFEDIQNKFPIDFEKVAEGEAVLVFAQAGDSPEPVMRLAIPYGKREEDGFTQALIVEAKPKRFMALFTETPGFENFLVNSSGQLVADTLSSRYSPGQDLSRLKPVRWARSSGNVHGSLEYSDRSDSPLRYSSFNKITLGSAQFYVLTQASRAPIDAQLKRCAQAVTAIALALMILTAAWTAWMAWRWIASPVRVLREKLAVHWPPLMGRPGASSLSKSAFSENDEIEALADDLESVCDDLDKMGTQGSGKSAAEVLAKKNNATEAVPPALVKFKDAALRTSVETGKVSPNGLRFEAVVLCARFPRLEDLARDLPPKAFVSALNEYYRRASEAVESRGGVVDRIHGGTLVAFWGVPKAKADDVERALDACQLLRAAATPMKSSLSMAVHQGSIIAGQVGAPDRLEFSAVGEAIEMAERLASFADQFGTDLVLTGSAAEQAPARYSTNRLTAGDDETPELFEVNEAATKKRVA